MGGDCVPTNASGCSVDEDCCAFPQRPSEYSGVFCDRPTGFAAARKRGIRLLDVCLHNGGQADSTLNISARRSQIRRLENRFIVLPHIQTILCAIEKNGLSVQNAIARAIHPDPHPDFNATVTNGFRYSPDRWDMDEDLIRQKLHDSRWRRIIVHRSPLDRFVSAYNSKCKNADGDGKRHCWELFGAENLSMHDVAARLDRRVPTNPHWLPQARFCGGLTATYTHAIPFDELASRLPRALGVREDTIAGAVHASGILATHITNASGASHWLPAKLQATLRRIYREDIELELGTPHARLCATSTPDCGRLDRE